MTLSVGDHVIIKRGCTIVTGEAYHEFEVLDISYEGLSEDGKPLYTVKLKMVE